MSDITLRSPHFTGVGGLLARLRTLLDEWFEHTDQPVAELQRLSEHLLIDIGIDPQDIPRPSMEEANRLSLRERGWPSRRSQ